MMNKKWLVLLYTYLFDGYFLHIYIYAYCIHVLVCTYIYIYAYCIHVLVCTYIYIYQGGRGNEPGTGNRHRQETKRKGTAPVK